MKNIIILCSLICCVKLATGQSVLESIIAATPSGIEVPFDGGTYTIHFYSDTRINDYEIETALRQSLPPDCSDFRFSVAESPHSYQEGTITLTVPRNRRYMRIWEYKSEHIRLGVRQKGNYGSMRRFEVSGGGVSVNSSMVHITLSGSEPGVTYRLKRDGNVVATKIGPPNFDVQDLPEFPEDPKEDRWVSEEKYRLYLESPLTFSVTEPGEYQIEGTTGTEVFPMKGCVIVSSYDGQEYSTGKNYIVNNKYHAATAVGDRTKRTEDILYMDGMGRTVQEIQISATPGGNGDIILPAQYGQYGRTEKTYLPYARTNNNGAYYNNPMASSNWSIYGLEDQKYAFHHTQYDNSPLNRVLKETGPGKVWHQGDKGVSTDYRANEANQVRLWKIAQNGTLSSSGMYPLHVLQRIITTDEDGNVSENFINQLGQTILTVTLNDSERLQTYFIYDILGRLRYVLPPELSASLGNTQLPTTTQLNDHAFSYTYDKRGRNIVKKLPGCAPIYYVYDAKDRLALSQDGNQRANGKWDYYLYDTQNRVIESGEVVISGNPSHTTLCNQVSNIRNFTPQGTFTPLQYSLYDSYDSTALIPPLAFAPCNGFESNPYDLTSGLLTTTRTRIIGENNWITTIYYYDDRCREIQQVSQNALGGVSRYYSAYDYTDNLIRQRETHSRTGNITDITETVYTYDQRGRLLNQTTTLNQSDPATTTYSYDAIGRLTGKSYKSGNNPALHESMAYNVRGWLTFKQNFHFSQQLRYNTTSLSGNTAHYNGNISEWEWRHINGTTVTEHIYAFTYDPLNRLTGAIYYSKNNGINTWSNLNQFTENNITYDHNGNIKTLSRTQGISPTLNLSYNYNGNQLSSISGGMTEGYTYDPNGNMTTDGRKNLKLEFNSLNLLAKVKDASTNADKAVYRYLADGSKLSVRNAANGAEGFDYLGSLTYKKDATGLKLEAAAIGDGRIVFNNNGTYSTKFFFTDHLGSVRVVVDGTTLNVDERNDYYPFGAKHPNTQYPTADNRYTYNGKERQKTGNLEYLDYGARMYDAELGRWFVVDPMVEKYSHFSPYLYCNGNPLVFFDPNGEEGIPFIRKYTYGNNWLMNVIHILPNAASNIGNIFIGAANAFATDMKYIYNEGFAAYGNANVDQFKQSVNAIGDQFQQAVSYVRETPALDQLKDFGSSFISAQNWENAATIAGMSAIGGSMMSKTNVTKINISNFSNAAKEGTKGRLNLFKWGAEQTTKSTGWKTGDYMLHLPNQGTPKLNWKANYGALRREMRLGNPIYDSYRLPNGNLIPTEGFLNAERFTLQSRGWLYSPSQGAWLPPIN